MAHISNEVEDYTQHIICKTNVVPETLKVLNAVIADFKLQDEFTDLVIKLEELGRELDDLLKSMIIKGSQLGLFISRTLEELDLENDPRVQQLSELSNAYLQRKKMPKLIEELNKKMETVCMEIETMQNKIPDQQELFIWLLPVLYILENIIRITLDTERYFQSVLSNNQFYVLKHRRLSLAAKPLLNNYETVKDMGMVVEKVWFSKREVAEKYYSILKTCYQAQSETEILLFLCLHDFEKCTRSEQFVRILKARYTFMILGSRADQFSNQDQWRDYIVRLRQELEHDPVSIPRVMNILLKAIDLVYGRFKDLRKSGFSLDNNLVRGSIEAGLVCLSVLIEGLCVRKYKNQNEKSPHMAHEKPAIKEELLDKYKIMFRSQSTEPVVDGISSVDKLKLLNDRLAPLKFKNIAAINTELVCEGKVDKETDEPTLMNAKNTEQAKKVKKSPPKYAKHDVIGSSMRSRDCVQRERKSVAVTETKVKVSSSFGQTPNARPSFSSLKRQLNQQMDKVTAVKNKNA
ncbi:hypothetical protein Ciccas_008107 [Cichlidogyrus casuarinus]|uniref:Uncharacterized protein n=1 Tax=Cichlidogyrus casuarinus TaxID=1844966 RepID=A0ABD2Q0W8_9PLAT